MAESRSSFAFLVVTYNHQEYILEHLESIKYLVQTHGAHLEVDLIVNDDCSRDQTRTLVDAWLAVNSQLFRHVTTIYNPKNLGTCTSIDNMLTHMVADRCKITAGDDVYSFENIFELTEHNLDDAMVSGYALYLFGNELLVDKLAIFLTTATQAVYKNESLLHRFKHLSFNNAPNILYATRCLLNPKIRAFLQRFDVVEDWPLQIAIAREFPMHKFALIGKILVYYRRTTGSTYIVASTRFVNDKLKVYEDLIKNEKNWFERVRLVCRKYGFQSQSRWINKFLNIDFYLFCFSCLYLMPCIVKKQNELETVLPLHRQHYANIKAATATHLANSSRENLST